MALVNLNFDPEYHIFGDIDNFDDIPEYLLNLKNKDIIQKLADGIYEHWDINEMILPDYEFESYDYPYGVADNYQQILERDPDVQECINDPDKNFIIQLCWIAKADQPEWGGWRWEKWGEYIGDFQPKSMYLYDEPKIDGIYVYQVFEVININ